MTTVVEAPVRSAAAALAGFCTEIRYDALPAEVRERAKELTLDLLGVALRGSAESSSKPPMAVARETQPHGSASVIGAGFSTAASWAALVNGTSAHSIEMDDVTRESSLHPGVGVIPTAFAVAEEQRLAATAFLEAVVAGYEVTMRVGTALNPTSAYRRGFHPTGVAGVFGAAAAAGRLFGLEAEALKRAFGIGGTMAAGSLEYLSDGAWTKRLNPGWAAHGGIIATQLARAGFTGPASVFEGPLGFLHGYSDEAVAERLLEGLGDSFQIMHVSIKPYTCCRYNHGLIDCVLVLKDEHGIRPEDVETIRLGVLSAGRMLVAEPVEQKRAPRNVVDAQFSAPFAAAMALVRGAAKLDEYTQANVDDPTVRSLMERTECYSDPSLDAGFPVLWPAAAEIRLRDGRTVSTRVEYATGEPENPVSRDGLVDKFTSLAGGVLSDSAAQDLARRILSIEREADLRGIGQVLRG